MINESMKYVRFDWAAKRMLRDKANFVVLEGLISVLTNENVKITEILESESNQKTESDKFNRVDIKAKNEKGEIVLIEIQQIRELYYLQRIIYGVAKSITEHINLGEKYDHIKKIYSISIVYFDLGKGNDYVYHGQNVLKGIHTGDTLELTEKDKDGILCNVSSKDVFPEYYIIRVNEFNKVATTPLEEWLDYLKNGHIKDDTTTPGLQEAKKRLQYMQMSKEEQQAYDEHIDAIMTQNGVLDASKMEGRMEEKVEVAREMKKDGIDIEMIKKYTKLTDKDIEAIQIDD